MQVAYRIGAAAPASHLFDVILEITDIVEAEVIVRLPAWIPGSYMIRDYARHVVALQARDARGALVAVERLDKSSWQISAGGTELTVLLQVYAWDVSVRGAHLDTSHAYFNGVCVFPEVLGATPGFDVEIDRFSGLPAEVVVATSLPPVSVDTAGFGHYRVGDYDELIDHPVEI
ncbi:MAG: peptidase M61, partial [Pseudomonadota bacterium]